MAQRRIETLSVMAEVDVDDVMESLSDDQIFDEAKRRRKSTPSASFSTNAEIVARAINLIHLGRVDDGTTLLEREFMPRWRDMAECDAAYRTAMALRHGA